MIRTPGEASRRPGLAVVGVFLFLACSLAYHNFFSGNNISAIGLNSASLLIAAIGSMALLVSGNIDLSIGSQYAFVSVVLAIVARDTGSGVLAAGVAVALGFACGLVNGLLVIGLSISPLIVTLAMLSVYSGLAYVVNNGQSVFALPRSFTSFGQEHIIGIPVVVVIAVAVFVVGALALMTTVSGIRLFAIGGNRSAARLVGVPVDRMVVGTYAINGALIGVLALLSTAQLASGSPTVGVDFELEVLTAVILGGVSFTGGSGNPIGVMVGVAVIGILDAGLIFAGLADWWQQIARGSVLLVALAADQVLRQRRARAFVEETAAPAPPAQATGYQPVARFEAADVVLEVKNVSVRFAGVRALEGVNLRVEAGEVVCLVGDNGAGKSTLLKVICGALPATSGTTELGGRPLTHDPQSARHLGVETVYQQPALCWNLGAADNLTLGIEPSRRFAGVIPVFDHLAAEQMIRSYLESFGLAIRDLQQPIAHLSNGEQQMIAIMRVLRQEAKLVLFDEPTAALGVHQGTELLRLVRSIAATGRPVLMVTHDVEEVFEVADRVVVLQQGRVIFDGPLEHVTRLELLQLMSGRSRAEAARTVQAISTERRRIERDLHDGAQQHLVNAGLMLGMAFDQLRESPNDHLTQLLASSGETLREALSELRNLSRGIYPAVLTERGLVAALESLATRSTLPVEIIAGEVPRFPEEVEVVAYFVVAEALTNAQKHAQASVLVVTINPGEGQVTLVVADDGVGGVDEAAGTGLLGLRGRVASVGGTLRVVSTPGVGTQLLVSLPTTVPSRHVRT